MKTWRPTTAGILNIIAGAISALFAISLVITIAAASTWTIYLDVVSPAELPFITSLVNTILIIFLVLSIIAAAVPLVGGVLAVQRKRWGWALAGSIVAIFGVFPLGVLSTIFVAMAKEEFGS